MIRVGIIGSTGYGGYQLVSLLLRHSFVKIEFLVSSNYSGESYFEVFPALDTLTNIKCINMQETYRFIPYVDVIFLAMPHGHSFEITKFAREHKVVVIDLGADYRLKDYLSYENWYKVAHKNINFLKESVYGLPEIKRSSIKNANIIANPGCYPTATILGLAPLLKNNIIDKNFIIVDGKSGVTGAGRSPSPSTHYPETNESIKAYGIGTHRHTPEIEQELSEISNSDIKIQFTPHLVPMNRGILISSYSKSLKNISNTELLNIYREFYRDEYFVRIKEIIPETKFVSMSNFCDISVRYDSRTKNIIVISAIDNLMKGAASQGIQNMNIKFGIPEKTGIDLVPSYL